MQEIKEKSKIISGDINILVLRIVRLSRQKIKQMRHKINSTD